MARYVTAVVFAAAASWALLCLCTPPSVWAASTAPSRTPSFAAWRTLHGVEYDTAKEAAWRGEVYAAHAAAIAAHNTRAARGEESYTMATNAFSDRTFEEFRAWARDIGAPGTVSDPAALRRLLGQQTPSAPTTAPASSTSVTLQQQPSSVNWTDVLGPVRNDGTCGAAWSFTVTDTITALIALTKDTPPVPLSPQQLVDCTQGRPWGLNGCHGGWPSLAYGYSSANGLCTDADYPWHATASPCHANCTRALPPDTITYAALVPLESAFMQRLATQPVMTAIGIVPEFQHYHSGVFSPPCNVTFEHCITLAGYGTTTTTTTTTTTAAGRVAGVGEQAGAGGQAYWLVRNNFGPTWGDAGYMKLARGVTYAGGVHGQCDVLGLGLYPQLA